MLIRKAGIPLIVAWFGLLALTSGSCSVSEEEGQFACAGNADCPAGWRCDVSGDRRCYSPEGKESLWDSETSDSAGTDSGTGTETSGSDSMTDSVSDTIEDTGTATEDSEPGTATGTDDTGMDTGTATEDTATESATDTDDTGSETETADTATETVDTESETVDTESDTVDTESDTVDTESDTADTATDTETVDTGTDTETVTDSSSCASPVAITMYNDVWHGKWTEQGAAFFPAEPNGCGEGGGRDVWFLLTIPAGETITILETTNSEVILRTVADCSATDCMDSASQPERLRLTNSFGAPMDFYLIVSEDPTNTFDDFTVTFSM